MLETVHLLRPVLPRSTLTRDTPPFLCRLISVTSADPPNCVPMSLPTCCLDGTTLDWRHNSNYFFPFPL